MDNANKFIVFLDEFGAMFPLTAQYKIFSICVISQYHTVFLTGALGLNRCDTSVLRASAG